MEVFTYQVKADELDERFIEALKSLFKDAEIAISVRRVNGASKPKQTLSEMIAERGADPVRYVVPGEVFSQLADSFLEDEDFDIAGEIKKYKIVKP